MPKSWFGRTTLNGEKKGMALHLGEILHLLVLFRARMSLVITEQIIYIFTLKLR